MATAQYDKQYVLEKARSAVKSIQTYRALKINAHIKRMVDRYNSRTFWDVLCDNVFGPYTFSKIQHPDYSKFTEYVDELPEEYLQIMEAANYEYLDGVYSFETDLGFCKRVINLCNTTQSAFITLTDKEIVDLSYQYHKCPLSY